ncbi:cation:proton antiporter [Thermovibrio ammonificans]|uniref:Sodium/hydrogen exchanger n=1 Tax=Thermovibrio ammonificans (strain DSM 15698 / JCM 12110 / HB-1) TaxID=648996 RepID=E8T633_THEA1|nr:cation:proton antiporter [Thermovibrio ammonificans]ADU96617.1 sodium/hydrogen exchanger [Thermovibrio ammonificans HB-1]
MKIQTESLIVSLLIIVAGIGAMEVGFSSSIFEILAGTFASNFLDLGDLGWMEFLANLGLLGLMFFAGLETDPELMKRNFLKSLFIGASSYFFPLLVVSVVAHFILGYSPKASLLIGIALSTTSLALVYPLLKEKGILKYPTGQTLLAAAMIVDISSMLTMSFLFEGINLYNLLFAVSLVLLLVRLPRWGERLFNRYAGNQIEFKTRFIILVLIALGFLSETVHINEAVLAFTTGIFFAELFKKDRLIEKKIRAIIFGFLAPFFFFKAGYSVKLSVVSPKVILLSLFLGSIAFLTKYAGTVFATASLFKGAVYKLAGLFFNMRLTFGIVASIFGLNSGLIDEETYVALLLIIVATSLISSVISKGLPHEVEEDLLEDIFKI